MKLHSHIRAALRGAWLRYPARSEALKNARLRRGIYLCRSCNQEFGPREIEVDHIIPVGATPGSNRSTPEHTWDKFIERLFCESNGLAILCKKCHREK